MSEKKVVHCYQNPSYNFREPYTKSNLSSDSKDAKLVPDLKLSQSPNNFQQDIFTYLLILEPVSCASASTTFSQNRQPNK